MKTMIAKFKSRCSECNGVIHPGDAIAFFGRGDTRHADCVNVGEAGEDGQDDGEDCWPPSRAQLASDKRLAERGLSVTRFSSGAVMTQNSRGRCEDAPCCGCCD